jgi:hypothetical protein
MRLGMDYLTSDVGVPCCSAARRVRLVADGGGLENR